MKPEEAVKAGEALTRVMDRVTYLHTRLRDSNWADLSRFGFLKETPDSLDALTGIRKNIEELHHYLKENDDLDFKSLLVDYKKIESLIEKNIEFEEKKESKLEGIHEKLRAEHPETFAALQQSVLSLLLKTRFLLERSLLFIERASPSPAIMGEASERKELFDLLQDKENELNELREKYDRVRKQTFLGFAHEENAAELERELNKLNIKLEKERNQFGGLLTEFRLKIVSMQAEFLELNDHISSIENVYGDYSEKSSELVMLLKKERDFAKKTLLDVENESLQLRSNYSMEILKLEEKKAEARETAFEDTRNIISKLQEDLEDKENMLQHFKEIAKRKEKESQELEEKLSYLNAAMKTKGVKKDKKE